MQPKKLEQPAPKGDIEIGSQVKLEGYDEVGTVVGQQGDRFEVEIGNVKLWVNRSKLVFAGESVKKKDQRIKIRVETSKQAVSGELDLRGLTADEAYPLLEKYLFDAYNSGWTSVNIIHGKGTGALRAKVNEFLADHPLVESSRTGRPEEGDYGVTVVRLAR